MCASTKIVRSKPVIDTIVSSKSGTDITEYSYTSAMHRPNVNSISYLVR